MKPTVSLGLLTDVHYADAPARGTRFYRESLGKVREAVDAFAGKVDGIVHLGDLIDNAPGVGVDGERAFLRTIDAELRRLKRPRHFVLGNHCVGALTKPDYLQTVGQRRSYYGFSQGGWHFILLDACFRKDFTPYAAGNFAWTDTEIPLEERLWLEMELSRHRHCPTVVFCHQRLDLPWGDVHGVNRAAAVRDLLERHGNVRAVFMGHTHANTFQTIGGIPYRTLHAVVEGTGAQSNGYSRLECLADGTCQLIGYRQHQDPILRGDRSGKGVPSDNERLQVADACRTGTG